MTSSVSKGVFVFKNGFKAASKKGRKSKEPTSIEGSLWYQEYTKLWTSIEAHINELNKDMFSNVLRSTVEHVKQVYRNPVEEIPTVALLTGINMPDHKAQFGALRHEIIKAVTKHVAILNSEDCGNLKSLVENFVRQLVVKEDDDSDRDSDFDGEVATSSTFCVKKSQCNFSVLQSWYEDLYLKSSKASSSPKKKLKTKHEKQVIVVIIPDFEGFPSKVLEDFISIASTYVNILPLVIVFGVATSVSVLHQSLPYHVSSKISIQVFRSTPSSAYLNKILENILFTQNCPFHLGGKVFNLFTEIFSYYDLSVSGFVQNFKYAMFEHFSNGNAMILCSKNYKKALHILLPEDIEDIRRLPSFRPFVEAEILPENRIKLINNNEYFLSVLKTKIGDILQFSRKLHLFLRCLHILVSDLPNTPMGKEIREIYGKVVSGHIASSAEYKECFQILSFQSKDGLRAKLTKIINTLENNMDYSTSKIADVEDIALIVVTLQKYVDKLVNPQLIEEEEEAESQEEHLDTQMDRKNLREKLYQRIKEKPLSQSDKTRSDILEYLSRVFESNLLEPKQLPFHELFFFDDISIQSVIIGSHRAAIHRALVDPQFYLQCSCCEIEDESRILPSMPDISIGYKLHLEAGKMINLYDWLQAFLSIVDPDSFQEDQSKTTVKPDVQARFTQVVAELEYLGFIKSSKRKTDHVTRLTWGG